MGLIGKLCDNCRQTKYDSRIEATPESGVFILSPINGEILSADDEKIIIAYNEDDCKFNVVIDGKGNWKEHAKKDQIVNQGEQIGKGEGSKIKLTVPSKSYVPGFGDEDISTGTPKRCTKKTKTKDPNEDNSGNNNKKIADRDPDIDRKVYGTAAWVPFGLWQGVTSPFTTESEEEKINLLEDINRIKQLMK